jgi:glucans biosynthesis protein
MVALQIICRRRSAYHNAVDPDMVDAAELVETAIQTHSADILKCFATLATNNMRPLAAPGNRDLGPGDNTGRDRAAASRVHLSTPMEINLVAEGIARRVIYDPALFDFGKLAVPKNLADIGFSGFRVLAQGQDGFSALAIFQGASFFRAVAPGQTLGTRGTMARAMSIKTADPRGEEFPAFRSVWIERTTLAAGALVIHALIGSESVTGAYRFTLRPGEATIIDTECALFARAAVDNLGLATMSATHLSGPIDERRNDDLRPSVSEVTPPDIDRQGSGCGGRSPIATLANFQLRR